MLIADDSSEWCAILTRILQPEFNIAGVVVRGDHVVSRAVALRPDIVTLDVSMPGISGLQLLPQLRSTMPNTVIVVVTAATEQLYMDEAHSRGADGYVLKGSALTDLIPAIQKGRQPEHSLQQHKE